MTSLSRFSPGCNCRCTCLVFGDKFNRSDSDDLGPNWEVIQPYWEIEGDWLRTTTHGALVVTTASTERQSGMVTVRAGLAIWLRLCWNDVNVSFVAGDQFPFTPGALAQQISGDHCLLPVGGRAGLANKDGFWRVIGAYRDEDNYLFGDFAPEESVFLTGIFRVGERVDGQERIITSINIAAGSSGWSPVSFDDFEFSELSPEVPECPPCESCSDHCIDQMPRRMYVRLPDDLETDCQDVYEAQELELELLHELNPGEFFSLDPLLHPWSCMYRTVGDSLGFVQCTFDVPSGPYFLRADAWWALGQWHVLVVVYNAFQAKYYYFTRLAVLPEACSGKEWELELAQSSEVGLTLYSPLILRASYETGPGYCQSVDCCDDAELPGTLYVTYSINGTPVMTDEPFDGGQDPFGVPNTFEYLGSGEFGSVGFRCNEGEHAIFVDPLNDVVFEFTIDSCEPFHGVATYTSGGNTYELEIIE